MICMITGLPHHGDTCAKCAAYEVVLEHARGDAAYLAAKQEADRAWKALLSARDAHIDAKALKALDKLEVAWLRASDAARAAFSKACDDYKATHPQGTDA